MALLWSGQLVGTQLLSYGPEGTHALRSSTQFWPTVGLRLALSPLNRRDHEAALTGPGDNPPGATADCLGEPFREQHGRIPSAADPGASAARRPSPPGSGLDRAPEVVVGHTHHRDIFSGLGHQHRLL